MCQMEVEIERELESHDTEKNMRSCTEPEYTCSLFVAFTNSSTMKDGIKRVAMSERLRRRSSGDDRCRADVCQSRLWQSDVKREAHSDGNQLSSQFLRRLAS